MLLSTTSANTGSRAWIRCGILVTIGLYFLAPVRAQERLPMQALSLESLDSFNAPPANWQLVSHVQSDRHVRHDLVSEPGHGVLINSPSPESNANLFTAWTHGDMDLELQFMMPQGSNSGIYLQGRYEIQLLDSWGKPSVTFGDVGGVYQRWDEEAQRGFEGRPPRLNASRAPGLWQTLKIAFKAPVFDASGQKTRQARFERVELNGRVVQENVTISGPTRAAAYQDEAAVGPLMIQGDHGPVAFRNIRYKVYESDVVTVSQLEFREFGEQFDAWPEDSQLTAPLVAGQAEGFSGHDISVGAPAAIAYTGQIHVPRDGLYRFGLILDWITGDPHFRDRRIGGAQLHVNSELLLEHHKNAPYVHADAQLDAGTHPFTFTVFKSTGGRRLNFGLSVEGPDTPMQWLRELESQAPHAPPIHVQPTREPVILRGFVKHHDTKRTHAVSVGDPSGLHYSLDLATGALLHVWRGPFTDVTQMWHNRGHNQLAEPRGAALTLSGKGFLLSGDNVSDSLTFAGYRLDSTGRPSFLYLLGNVLIADRVEPSANGSYLSRTLTLEGEPQDILRIRAAENDLIVPMDEGRYSVGGWAWYIEAAHNATIQPDSTLILSVEFSNGHAEVSYDIVW